MRSESIKGVGAILIAAALFTVMATGTKFAAQFGVPHGEITFFRFASGFLVLVILSRAGIIKTEFINRRWLLLRGLFGGSAISCYFFALSNGTLANAVVLNACYPVFVALFSFIFIGEKVRKFVYPILLVAFAGIVLVIGPDPQQVSPADFWALASAVLASLGILTLRKLRETDSVWTILLALNGIGMVLSAGFFLSDPVWPTPAGWIAIIVVAASSNFAQASLTYGYKYISASEGSILIKVSVVFSAFIGYLVFDEAITPQLVTGALLVLGSGAVLTALIHRAGKQPPAPSAPH